MSIQIDSITGYVGLALLAFGGFMILAGFDIISVQQVTVKRGRRTWVLGFIFAVVGLVMLFPEFNSSYKVTNPEAVIENTPTTTEFTDTLNEWLPIDFIIAKSSLWQDTTGGIYTALGSEDAFAWSKEQYEGNLMISFDIQSSADRASGCIILFGDGHGFSHGNLIFCVDWDGYGLEKHTIYHEGENYLVFTHSEVNLNQKVYSVTIEINDDFASMQVNDEQVISSSFDPDEINHSGRIGLLKKWFDPTVTFSNVRIRTSGNGG